MGHNVNDEKDLVIRIADQKGGSPTGQLIFEDIEFGGERDNTEHAGIGNDKTKGVSYGNRRYNLNETMICNEAQAAVARQIDQNDYVEGWVRVDGGNNYSAGQLHWNDWTLSSSDDGDTTFEIDCIVTNPNIS